MMRKMNFAFGLIVLVSAASSYACRYETTTIGIVANGTGVVETENISRHGQNFIIVKHLVDTTELFRIYSAVQRLDANKSVDVIVLIDYDAILLTIPTYFQTRNKILIKLGARDGHNMISDVLSNVLHPTRACNSNDRRCSHDSLPSKTYCLTDSNITNKNRDELVIANSVPPAIQAVVKLLQWRNIFIFYESSKEKELSSLVDGLSKDGVLFAMYNVDHVKDVLSVLKQIYKLKGAAKKDIHVVIVCGVANTKRVLKAANKFDSLHNEKTVLKMFSKWLVALYGYSRAAANELKNHAKDLDNVAVLALPQQRRLYMQNVYDCIDSTSLELLREELDGSTEIGCKQKFIEMFEKNTYSLNPTNECRGFYIDTLLWKEKGRQFSSVGYADINGKLALNSDVFPNTRFGYNKRSFIVSTLAYSPFVVKRKVNNTFIYEGFCMDLLKELSNKLNFTYTITEPADRKWGSVINRVNLTFNGLVGQLQREEVDIVASAISVQAERDPAMDFSYPYYYGYTTVLVKKPDIYATKWRTLVDPFKWEVLLTIGASLLVVTVLVFLLEKYNPFYTIPQQAALREENGGLHTWHSSFWYVFGALLCQGGIHLPESTAGRTLISCWWLTCIIIVGTYCGNLIAFLTVTKEKPPFNTLQDMIELKGTYKWGTIGGTVWESMFPNSSNPTFRKMGEAFIEFNKSDPTILHGNPAFHVQRVKKGKYAWIGDKTYMEIAMATECSLMTIKEEFMPLIYVLGFKNNSSHAAIFSEQIIKIHEGGLLQIWKRKWWPKSSFCSGNSITEAKPISLMDVQSAFYVCFIGIVFGLFAFLVEKVVHRYRTLSPRIKTIQ